MLKSHAEGETTLFSHAKATLDSGIILRKTYAWYRGRIELMDFIDVMNVAS